MPRSFEALAAWAGPVSGHTIEPLEPITTKLNVVANGSDDAQTIGQ